MKKAIFILAVLICAKQASAEPLCAAIYPCENPRLLQQLIQGECGPYYQKICTLAAPQKKVPAAIKKGKHRLNRLRKQRMVMRKKARR